MKNQLLITNIDLIPSAESREVQHDSFILIKGATIALTGPMYDCPDNKGQTVLDGQGQLAMPGLVNGHCHAPMVLFRGLADDLALLTWLQEYIFPAEAKHVHQNMVYWCTRLAAAEMLLGGITTVADGYFHEHQVAQACSEVGLRCIPAQGLIDFPAPGIPEPEKKFLHAEAFLKEWHLRHPLITPALFAHSPYTCSNGTLKSAKTLCRAHNLPLFIHVAETKEEHRQIAQPLGTTTVEHLDHLGILDENTVCIHCVWLNESDLDILAKRKSSIIHCPQSNLKLASGKAPLQEMLQRNIAVGLGTDGAASNNSLDMFREMSCAAKLHKVLPNNPIAAPARHILSMATSTGAQALNQSAGAGKLLAGSPADIILLDTNRPHLQPFYSVDSLVYAGDAAIVQSVVVNGQVVVHKRELQTIDLKETMFQVRQLAAQLTA